MESCAFDRRTPCAYPSLSKERLVGHSDIAPGRKSDPGAAFDWAHLRSLLGLTRSPAIVAPQHLGAAFVAREYPR